MAEPISAGTGGQVVHDSPGGPVFIVGMNGSGTTMLLDCLNSHPNLYGFPLETRVIPLHLRRYKDSELVDRKRFLALWNEIRNIVYFKIVNGGVAPPLPDDWADRERSRKTVLDGVFGYFAQREGKRRWCEKTPYYALHMGILADAHPEARFVHVIRDGRDCAASFHRRWRYTPARTMEQWKHVVTLGREQGRALGDRYMEIRYEELTDWPRTTMRRLCDFLGEPYVSDILEVGRERSELKTLAVRIVPNKEKWRTYFAPRELELLEAIGGRMLHECGYETSNTAGDSSVEPLRMSYWGMRDNARRGLEVLGRLATTTDWRRRRLLLQRLATSVRHKFAHHDG